MIDYRTVSMCISCEYCEGWNAAVEAIRKKERIDYKTAFMCSSDDYCDGWNDAVKMMKINVDNR